MVMCVGVVAVMVLVVVLEVVGVGVRVVAVYGVLVIDGKLVGEVVALGFWPNMSPEKSRIGISSIIISPIAMPARNVFDFLGFGG